jgi:hypothetical protein
MQVSGEISWQAKISVAAISSTRTVTTRRTVDLCAMVAVSYSATGDTRLVTGSLRFRPLTLFIRSAKGAAARRQTEKELIAPLGGALDTASVLREFLKREEADEKAGLPTRYL